MGECRGATPHCRGRGGVPHKHTGRVGGKNHVRQAQSRKGLQRGEPPTETQRQLPIAPSPPQPLHWFTCVIHAPTPVVPAKAGTSNPCPCWGCTGGIPAPCVGCRGGSRTARRSRHPKRIPNPTTTAHCAIAAPAPTLLHASFTRRALVVPAKAGTSNPCLRFGVGAVREPPEGHAIPNVPPQPNDNCPLRHRRASPYTYASFTRRPPVVPAKAGTSNPCLRFGVGAVREPPEGHAIPNVSPTQRQLPIAPSPRQPYIGCMRHSRAEYPSFPRRREKSPLPLGEG